MRLLWHFSEDPSIELFRPRTGAEAAPTQPLVWAIDDEHVPAYWFPRDCPRVTFWRGTDEPGPFGAALLTGVGAPRVHAVEWAWRERIAATSLYRYGLDAVAFQRWPHAGGYHVCRQAVRPVQVEPVGDLLALHAQAGIELRFVPRLQPLISAVRDSGLAFSIIRCRERTARLVRFVGSKPAGTDVEQPTTRERWTGGLVRSTADDGRAGGAAAPTVSICGTGPGRVPAWRPSWNRRRPSPRRRSCWSRWTASGPGARIDGPDGARRLAKSMKIPIYDVQIVGYPQRMRDYDARRRIERDRERRRDIGA